ncbi:N-acetylmuramidase family protein [Shewanella sp. OMA3-2]|uniref:N-acetylmuramidase family protein n=1 Tax=Shewanella sp. OMA3-2 TaxID=2908650 RepID=UPI001F157598|nr:N-acetylmuramidase family protein [Shewanella sp. OMA3-2]UJF20501.1 N-acetylmuramidase family protein [Shewanella sp. OMA3-2]
MSSIKITQAVGLGGTNNLNDVKVVKIALNKLLKLIPPTKSLIVDGRLGSRPESAKTVAAIKLFQSKILNMVRPDGKIDVNGRTHRKMNEKLLTTLSMVTYKLPIVSIETQMLSESDYLDIANQLGCKVAAIKAVADVESSGDAFFSNGKPKILYEAHIFSRLTNHKYDSSHPAVSSRTWNRSLYTGGSQEYARLEIAMSLDTSEALKSTSWGRFQIMGFNYSESGFTSVEAFVKAMFSSERKQLDAFVSFVKNKGLEKFLITLDWASFAKGYNGSQYKQNKYDVKLQKAFEKYDKK